jgi:endonuclease VIII
VPIWHPARVPEGDALHRIAARLQVLVGHRLEAESPHPRGLVTGVARAVDGRRLEKVDAVGKHLLLRFDGGVVVCSHLRMSGRWRVEPRARDATRRGRPWLVLRGGDWVATQWNGPVLTLDGRAVARLGPDLLAPATDIDLVRRRLRASDPSRPIGEALLDQRIVSGIGNMWVAEALWQARVSPWRAVQDVGDDRLSLALGWAQKAMREAVTAAGPARRVYRRARRGCSRCGTPIQSGGLGDANRTAYWCPSCQPASTSAEKEGFEPSRQGFPHLTP